MSSTEIDIPKVLGAVINVGTTEKSGNVAIGNNTTANMATTKIKDSQILGGTINFGKTTQSGNVAMGNQTTANIGSTNGRRLETCRRNGECRSD